MVEVWKLGVVVGMKKTRGGGKKAVKVKKKGFYEHFITIHCFLEFLLNYYYKLYLNIVKTANEANKAELTKTRKFSFSYKNKKREREHSLPLSLSRGSLTIEI